MKAKLERKQAKHRGLLVKIDAFKSTCVGTAASLTGNMKDLYDKFTAELKKTELAEQQLHIQVAEADAEVEDALKKNKEDDPKEDGTVANSDK